MKITLVDKDKINAVLRRQDFESEMEYRNGIAKERGYNVVRCPPPSGGG